MDNNNHGNAQMSNSNELSEDFYDQAEPVVSEPNHKFSGEVTKKSSKRKIGVLGTIFVILMLVAIGSVWLAKDALKEWQEERAKAALEKKNAAQANNTRPDRSFAELPSNFNQPAPEMPKLPVKSLEKLENGVPPAPIPPVDKVSAAPVKPAATTAPVAQPAPRPVPPPPPPIPFFEYPQDKPNLNLASVQDLARIEAQKAKPTKTAQASAVELGDRSYVLPRGAFVPCVLETQLFSNIPGQTSCSIPNDVYSDDGSRLLVPRGSTVVGTYGKTMEVGDSRIAVVWERLKTTDGYVLDIDSGASDGVGTMGVGGYVDNRWGERIGAALLLSLIDDAVDIAVADKGGSTGGGNNNYGQNSTRSAKNLAEKVLDSTVNLKPTLSVNRGQRLMIYVSKDLWFDSVYGE